MTYAHVTSKPQKYINCRRCHPVFSGLYRPRLHTGFARRIGGLAEPPTTTTPRQAVNWGAIPPERASGSPSFATGKRKGVVSQR